MQNWFDRKELSTNWQAATFRFNVRSFCDELRKEIWPVRLSGTCSVERSSFGKTALYSPVLARNFECYERRVRRIGENQTVNGFLEIMSVVDVLEWKRTRVSQFFVMTLVYGRDLI